MNIGILGTGAAGRSLAAGLAANGHAVRMGTRNVPATLANPGNAQMGLPPFADWHAANPAVQLSTFAEAAAFGELVVNATTGSGSLAALDEAGEASLAGKILLDLANPIGFKNGEPILFIVNDDSLGETIQRRFPAARVVKTFNTLPAPLMVNPTLLPGQHNAFLSGNDAEAKATVRDFLGTEFGWPAASFIDLGDITTSRGTEQLFPIGMRLWGALQTPLFSFSIVY